MMRRSGVRVGMVLVLVAAVGVFASCENGTDPATDGGTNGGTDTGSVLATVTADGSGLSGVTLELFAGSGTTVLETATTDAAGEATFTQLEAGSYEVEVTVPATYRLAAGSSARQTVNVVDGQESTVSFALETDPDANVVEVTLTNFEFTPGDLTIEPGTTVRWVNQTSTFHTVTPDGHSEWTESSLSEVGETFTHTFDTEGTFPYYCSPHRDLGMTGSVTVQAP
ncbi:MAG: plastocyanin/azurin family copper-binding protein [Candidatus Longimicrobiales bacterium M2_2A_002]